MIWIWIAAEAVVLLLLALSLFSRRLDGRWGSLIKFLGIIAALTIDVILIRMSDSNMGIKAITVMAALLLLIILQNIGGTITDEKFSQDSEQNSSSYIDEDDLEDL